MESSTQTLPRVAAGNEKRSGSGIRPRLRSLASPRPELAGLIALAALLNLWALGRNGWANDYYSGGVRSMSSSWHNFLYGSFDPAGLMTVDKPPLALWVQSLSVRIFGFHPLSMLIPQALMGVASVALVYDLTRRIWGRSAGFLAGLALAVTPVSVAISRHNNPDALLVLFSVAALWFLVRAFEDGRTRWLVASGLCVGLGFETKMAVALMVLPGIAAAWLWVAPAGRLRAFRQLLAGGAAMCAAGLAWPLLVLLTPAGDRPWISGTSDNSILSLIFGYNGLGRLTGQAGGPQAFGGGGPFGGSAGPLRLLNESLGGQAGWLLGVALVSIAGAVWVTRLDRGDRRSGWIIAVGGSFLTTAVAFSFAGGIFHPYYVSLLAPFIAALAGAAFAQARGSGMAARVTGAAAIVAGVTTELIALGRYQGELTWLIPILIVVCGGAALALLAPGGRGWRPIALAVGFGALLIAPSVWAADTLGHPTSGTFPAGGPESAQTDMGGPAGGAFAGGPPGAIGSGPSARSPMSGGMPSGAPAMGRMPPAGVLPGGVVPPAPGSSGVPSGTLPGLPGANGTLPGAGGMTGIGAPGGFGGSSQSLDAIVKYTKAHGGGTIGVSSQQEAASEIVTSGAPIAGLGGFSGRESAVSASWLADAVRAGRVRWVLSDGVGTMGLGQDGRTGSADAFAAVASACRKIPASAYATAGGSSSPASAATAKTGGSATSSGSLYDCRGDADAIGS